MKPRDPDTPQAEELLPLLVEILGDEAGQKAYLAIIRRFRGARVYFAKRIETEMLAAAIYDRRSRGETAQMIVDSLGIRRSRVDRLYAQELKRRRLLNAS